MIETSIFWRSRDLDCRIDFTNKLWSQFYLAGSHRVINPGIQHKEDREETPGENCLSYLAGARCLEYRPAEQQFQDISIGVDFEPLRTFGTAKENPSPSISSLITGQSAIDTDKTNYSHY